MLSRKFEFEQKGESTRNNISRKVLKVQKLHIRLTNIRNDMQNKIIADLMKTKLEYIAMEDLNVKGIMKNRYLSK